MNTTAFQKFLATGEYVPTEDAKPTSLAAHDRRFHPNGFDPKRDHCALRETMAKSDKFDNAIVGKQGSLKESEVLEKYADYFRTSSEMAALPENDPGRKAFESERDNFILENADIIEKNDDGYWDVMRVKKDERKKRRGDVAKWYDEYFKKAQEMAARPEWDYERIAFQNESDKYILDNADILEDLNDDSFWDVMRVKKAKKEKDNFLSAIARYEKEMEEKNGNVKVSSQVEYDNVMRNDWGKGRGSFEPTHWSDEQRRNFEKTNPEFAHKSHND